MLITISGPDGAGKTTQIEKLLKAYQVEGFSIISINDVMSSYDYNMGSNLTTYYEYFKKFDVIHTRFRLHSFESDIIMSVLETIPQGTDIKLTALSAYTAYYSYVQWNKYVLTPLLADGKLLICDKYYYDDVATKAAFGCPYKWLKKLHYDTLKPSLGLYMQQDAKILMERNMNRGDGRIIHYQNITGTERLLYYYNQIAKDENLAIINANQSIESIHQDIIRQLEIINLAPKQYKKQRITLDYPLRQ